LAKRPGGDVPPEIPDDHPSLPRKGVAKIGGMKLPVLPVAVIIFIAILAMGIFIEQANQYTEEEILIARGRYQDLQQPVYLQYYLPLSIAISAGFYLYGKSVNKRKEQIKIEKMEGDFKDVVYLLASRLGEKKPLEDAIGYVKHFMPESKVATELLENVQRNIMVMGLTLKSAIFDPTYGAIKNTPSRLMSSSFKIMTDSIELGPEVASASLVSLSEQLRNVQKINQLMKKLLDEVTSMMSSMASFIGPIVLGMVSSLQRVIVDIMTPLSENLQSDAGGNEKIAEATTAVGGDLLGKVSPEGMASSTEFQLIIAGYVILMVIIFSYFTGKVKYGDNRTAILMTMGKTLPVAVGVFCAALFMGQIMLGGIT
jgi:hypothetical protein